MFWMSMVKNGCGKCGDRILKFIKEKTEERTDGINCLHVDAWSQKSKADQSFFGWAWSKNGVASLITGLRCSNAIFLMLVQIQES